MARISLQKLAHYELAKFEAVFPELDEISRWQFDENESDTVHRKRLRSGRAKFISDLSTETGITISQTVFGELLDAARDYVDSARAPGRRKKTGRAELGKAKSEIEALAQAVESLHRSLVCVEGLIKDPLPGGEGIVRARNVCGVVPEIADGLEALLRQSLLGRSLDTFTHSLETSGNMRRALADLHTRLVSQVDTWNVRLGVTAARPAGRAMQVFLASLYEIYVSAGGKGSASWNTGSGTPSGGLGRFIVKLHGALPRDVRAPSNEALIKTFSRLKIQAPSFSKSHRDKR
jgi:hypothetical protein